MSKLKINMIGGGFQHLISTNGIEPKYMEWVKGSQSAPISIHIDYAITQQTNPYKKNYGWLCESKTIIGDLYNWCSNNIEYLKSNYISVFTHDVRLSSLSDIFVLTQCSAKSFLTHGEIYSKSKLVSMIASSKRMCAEHLYRQEVIKKYSGQCDHFGRGFNEIPNKEDGLIDYCFSFALENATYSNMFTEKITDCFMTGTIPIYYGIKNIGDYFNMDGIIVLTEDFKIEDLSFDLYNSKLNAVQENLRLSMDLLLAEDYISKNFLIQ
jgi:hypothetical protein